MKVRDKKDTLNKGRVQATCDVITEALSENYRILLQKCGTELVSRNDLTAIAEIGELQVDEIIDVMVFLLYLMEA